MKNLSIQELAEIFIANKSEKNFKTLMKRLQPGVLKAISMMEEDYDKRSEILNIVFAKAWSNIHQYNSDAGAFSTWIYRIAHNQCLLEKRHTSRTKSFDAMCEEGTLSESVYAEDCDFENFDTKPKFDVIEALYQKTVDAINSMKDNGKEGIMKTALKKWHIDKKPYKVIAEEMNIPENTAKNKVFRGKDLIRKVLTQNEPELVGLFINKEY